MTAARSPSLAASCSLPPSTSPAAASTGNAESSQVDAGDDPPTATAEPRSRSCYRAGSTCCRDDRNRQQRDTRASLPRRHAAKQARKVVVVVYCRETTASCCIYKKGYRYLYHGTGMFTSTVRRILVFTSTVIRHWEVTARVLKREPRCVSRPLR